MKKIALSTIAAAFVVFAHGASAGQLAKGTNFSVDGDGIECKVGATCTVKLTVTSLNKFHVNKEYPTKLKVDEIANVEFQGTDPAGKNVFSKAKNDFVLGPDDPAAKGPINGWMTVTFKGKSAGASKISGKLKLSVCSEANCQMETADVSVPVTVK